MSVKKQLLAAGCWLLDFSPWPLAFGSWLFLIGVIGIG